MAFATDLVNAVKPVGQMPEQTTVGVPARRVLVLLVLLAACVPAFAAATLHLNRAADQLGVELLRPYIQVKVGNSYVATVRNPGPLARLGLTGLNRGDRVICRVTGKHKIVVSNGSGDQTGPIVLADSGEIKHAEFVQQLNPHINTPPPGARKRGRARHR